MEFHAWVLIMRSGETITGEDDYPPEIAKMQARTFILKQPDSAPIEVEVPEGYALVFKRRVQMLMSSDMVHSGTRWKYLLGFEPLKQERSEALHGPGS
jgi:hypothetical protein